MQLKRLFLIDGPMEFGVDHYYLFDESSQSVVYRNMGEDITFSEVLTRESFQKALTRLPVSRASVEPSDQGMRLIVRAVQARQGAPEVLVL